MVANLTDDRAQLWQWIRHPTAVLSDGRKISESLYRRFLAEEIEKIRALYGSQSYAGSRMEEAMELFDALVTSEHFVEFLTLSAYEKLI